MYHKNGYSKFNKKLGHRMSILNSMMSAIIEYGSIETTIVRAKALRSYFEKILTKIKNNSNRLDIRSSIASKLTNDSVLKKLYDVVIKKIASRNGGYTRITRLYQRKSDGSTMVKIELLD